MSETPGSPKEIELSVASAAAESEIHKKAMSGPDPAARSYDRLAPIYDQRWRVYETATLGAALEWSPAHGGERVLDIACGTGELERRLLARRPDL